MTEPKAALTGVLLAISLARLRTSINPFSAEVTPSLSVGRWDLASMVETRSGRRGTVWREGSEEGSES